MSDTEPGHVGDFDRTAAGRPDPRVKTPTRQHRIQHDDTDYTAGYFPATPGAGEDVWQIHDPAGDLVLTVTADRLTEAQNEHTDLAARLRAQAQQLTDWADHVDRERELVAAIAAEEQPG